MRSYRTHQPKTVDDLKVIIEDMDYSYMEEESTHNYKCFSGNGWITLCTLVLFCTIPFRFHYLVLVVYIGLVILISQCYLYAYINLQEERMSLNKITLALDNLSDIERQIVIRQMGKYLDRWNESEKIYAFSTGLIRLEKFIKLVP